MGLDMYAFTLAERPAKDVDFLEEGSAVGEALFYWRKHPDLHGWMAALYFEKGGKGVDGFDGPGTFNCCPLVLDPGDLDKLEKAVLSDALPHTEGFYFGASHPRNKAATLEFIAKARNAITEGKTVYYTSWW